MSIAMIADRCDRKIRLTVVTPVFNEAGNLDRYLATVDAVLGSASSIALNVLFVDDGSLDDSWQRIANICAKDSRFTGIRLSRNFGAHVALAAGFDHISDADVIATLACDLQDPAETILAFVEQWRTGADIVWGSRRIRDDVRWKVVASRCLENLLRRYAMPAGSKFRTGSFFLIDRSVLECFKQFREHSRVTFALVAWTGFDQTTVDYDRRNRTVGASGWSFGKMLNSAYDVFIGFSPLPAKVLTGLGFSLSSISFLALFFLILNKFTAHVHQPGWTGIMASLFFLFGILFMMIGMIAEYLFRIFIESKGRPLYFVAKRSSGVGMPMEIRSAVSLGGERRPELVQEL